jgi:16S rRNA (guanine527-N7)-methyltransferase
VNDLEVAAGQPPVALLEVLHESQALGYIGDGDLLPHVAQARAFARAVGRPPTRALDLGSGGGLPGLVLAATAWADVDLCLLDAGQQRAAFLRRAVEALGLGAHVLVERGRAETLARRPDLRRRFDVVVARSFGPPAVVAECAAGFLEPGGLVVVSEPPSTEHGAGARDRWVHDEALAMLGLRRDGVGDVDGARFQRLRAEVACPDRFPRRDGIPAKRPLFT